ncbi:hypothetical protein M3J09_009807 [Ascochyta lentis]
MAVGLCKTDSEFLSLFILLSMKTLMNISQNEGLEKWNLLALCDTNVGVRKLHHYSCQPHTEPELVGPHRTSPRCCRYGCKYCGYRCLTVSSRVTVVGASTLLTDCPLLEK